MERRDKRGGVFFSHQALLKGSLFSLLVGCSFPQTPPSPPRRQPAVEAVARHVQIHLTTPQGRLLWEGKVGHLSAGSEAPWRLQEAECRWVAGPRPLSIRAPLLEWEPQGLTLRAPQGGEVQWGAYQIRVHQWRWLTRPGIFVAQGPTRLQSPKASLQTQRIEALPRLEEIRAEEVFWEAPHLGWGGTARRGTVEFQGKRLFLEEVELLPLSASAARGETMRIQAQRVEVDLEARRWRALQARWEGASFLGNAQELAGDPSPEHWEGKGVDLHGPAFHLTARTLLRQGDAWQFQGEVSLRLAKFPATLQTQRLLWKPPHLRAEGGFHWRAERGLELRGHRWAMNLETGAMEWE